MGFGHYTAYVKNKGKWYNMDDTEIEEQKVQEICSKAGYVLFYEKV